MKFTICLAAILSYTTNGIKLKGQSSFAGRYFNANDECIDLAQTKNHARMVLNKRPFALSQEDDSASLVGEKQIDQKDACVKSQESASKLCLPESNNFDQVYIATVYVGTPPQKMRAIFDTGSSNTWVLNQKAVKDGSQEKERAYNDTKSSTVHKTDQEAEISFGSGSLGGHFYSDTFRIGAPNQAQVELLNQQFGNVEKQDSIFRGDFEVLIGMAYPALAEPGVTPLFNNLMEQNLLQSQIFAYYMTSFVDKMESDLTFGYYDTSKFTGKIQWHPIKFKYMYGLQLDDIKVGNKSLGLCGPNGTFKKDCLVTVDSGTSLLAFPEKIYDQLPRLGMPTDQEALACEGGPSAIGELTYVINGHPYTLLAEDWLAPADGSQSLAQSRAQTRAKEWTYMKHGFSQGEHKVSPSSPDKDASTEKSGTKCFGQMMPMNLRKDMFLVGDVFMRKYYSIFDRENDRVGLATAV